ncbi:hypothetical protein [Cupriavidus basilensis]|uniref:Enolase n=1 Tax=Cupriavidus basilensis TaxID=68895 RepID=A0A643G124_9BURK|nr:hypothetical protein [Cupriavidus basilensis]MCP3021861.1 hypothetical protein [Cupriavidus basilensis]MDR3379833.1 hypothetical protein [Cupriavidus basilensis]QOT80259.1 hypothetical protein F7R26_022620 [Cupriavidus basilensis]
MPAASSSSKRAILVKPNQIGTLSEMPDTVGVAHAAGNRAVMSQRAAITSPPPSAGPGRCDTGRETSASGSRSWACR